MDVLSTESCTVWRANSKLQLEAPGPSDLNANAEWDSLAFQFPPSSFSAGRPKLYLALPTSTFAVRIEPYLPDSAVRYSKFPPCPFARCFSAWRTFNGLSYR